MTNQDFDRVLNSIREDLPTAEAARTAAERVREKLGTAGPGGICSKFRADFEAYRAGPLPEARRMLLEDHLHSCVACRREYSGAGVASVVTMPKRVPAAIRHAGWAAAAALLIGIIGIAGYAFSPRIDRALAAAGPRGTVESVKGTLVLVSGSGTTLLAAGAAIAEGQEIRTGKASRAVIRLRDGSRVEMDERSDLELSERWSGKTIRLARGSVLVEAAKQRRGRLEVATADSLVSVKGTIFGVSWGFKGSRVSVVEGEVKVDHAGAFKLLHRGDQTVTGSSMALTSVATDIAWSQNAAQYLAMLGDLAAIQAQIDQLPAPGLRYSSRLLDRVPADTVVVAAIPNLSQTLADAISIFEDRARQSASFATWWNGAASMAIRQAVDRARAVSDYLGDEILVMAPAKGAPVVLAEVRRAGLSEYLNQIGNTAPRAFEGNLVVLGATAVPPIGAFPASPLGVRLLESYRNGVGLLLAANMEQIVALNVPTTSVPNPAAIAGVDNLRFVVAESKTYLAAPVNTASMTFSGARHGLASWLANPGPMGSLEYVSPQASFATTFVTRDPRQLLSELLAAVGPQAAAVMNAIQQTAGFSPLDDVAGSLGGEATIAIDGPLLPVPSWKIAVEVDNPSRLEWAIEQIVAAALRNAPQSGITLVHEDVHGRTFYTLTLKAKIEYVFVDGYLLMAPDRALLTSAIDGRASGMTLPRSDAFRAQLPVDSHTDFSALAYYNLGSAVGPIVDQLKATGLLTPEQQKQISALTSNRKPTLVYAYGSPDQILVGSRNSLTGMGLDALSGLGFGATFAPLVRTVSLAPQ
ncbi:MAG TPA: FecR domain-containing protein [Bryobacteraceae bacterium]|nr:FecR domain-containing protein [Bryobacteraceae bacterium]